MFEMNEYDFLLIHLISLHPHDFVIQTYDFYVYICVVLLKSFPDLQTSQHTRALVTSDRSCNVWAWKSMVFVKASL